jgi:hypothetical protein
MFELDRLRTPMLVIFISFLAMGSHAHAQFTLSEAKEIAAYTLSMENVKKKYRVSVEIARHSGADPQLEKQMQSQADVNSIEEEIRLMQTIPVFVQALQAQGMSARDYAFTSEALKAAMLGGYPTGLSTKPSSASNVPIEVAASPDHIRFFQAHMTEIDKGVTEVGEAYKAGKATRR